MKKVFMLSLGLVFLGAGIASADFPPFPISWPPRKEARILLPIYPPGPPPVTKIMPPPPWDDMPHAESTIRGDEWPEY